MNSRHVLTLILVSLTLFWPLLFRHVGGDPSVYAYVGSCVADGYVPYRDAWDIKSPAIFFQYALPIWMFGRSDVAVLTFDWLIAVGGAFALFFTAGRIGGKAAGLFAGTAWLVAYHRFCTAGWFGQPETAAALLTTIVLLLAIQPDPLDEIDSFAGGILVGLLLCYKLPFVLVGLLLVPRLHSAVRRKMGWPALWPGVLGLTLVVGLVAAYFSFHGSLGDLVEGAVISPSLLTTHMTMPPLWQLQSLGSGLLTVLTWLPGIIVLACLGAYRFPQASTAERKLVCVALGLMLALVILQTRYFMYYWILMLPPLCILAGMGAGHLASFIRHHFKFEAVATVLVFALMAAASFPKAEFYWQSYLFGIRKGDRQATLAEYATNYGPLERTFRASQLVGLGERLGSVTRDGDTILSFDMDPALNFYSGRMQPSRFIYLWALDAPGFERFGWKREYSATIMRKRPAYILICRENRRPVYESDGLATLRKFPTLRKWIFETYSLSGRVGPIEVYRRKDYIKAS
ncbi:MAG: hypothetical protein H0W86_09370 [Armatimonadetes bacterium]|nr:hypothetical protein [Armatimonadota bacterium]